MMKLFWVFIFSFMVNLANAKNIDSELITKANDYLKNINNNIIQFEQYDTRGNATIGTLAISKPNKFRCDYADSYPLLIVGNEGNLYIYDFELEQYSVDKVNNSIFLLLTKNNLAKIPNLQILKTSQKKDSFFIEMKDTELDQKLKLGFSQKGLSYLEILEANGNNIVIEFTQNIAVKGFSQDLFIIKNPLIFGEPKKLKLEGIKAKSF